MRSIGANKMAARKTERDYDYVLLNTGYSQRIEDEELQKLNQVAGVEILARGYSACVGSHQFRLDCQYDATRGKWTKHVNAPAVVDALIKSEQHMDGLLVSIDTVGLFNLMYVLVSLEFCYGLDSVPEPMMREIKIETKIFSIPAGKMRTDYQTKRVLVLNFDTESG